MAGNNEEKKADFWAYIAKLKLRDQIAILIGVVAIGVGIFLAIFFSVSRMRVTEFHFPESVLRKSPSVQTYKQGTFSSLFIPIQFKGTEYGCYVGREESLSTEYGASFSFDDSKTIIVGVLDGISITEDDFYAYGVSYLMGNELIGNETFDIGLYDKGYLNTFMVEYKCGTVVCGDKTYYLVSYLFPDGDKKLCMMVVTEKKSSLELVNCQSLLNNVFFSMVRYEDDGSLEDAESSNDTGDTGNATEDDTDMSDMTVYERIEERDRQRDETAYHLEYPNAEDLEVTVHVGEELADMPVVFYINYTEVNSVPREAFLRSPVDSKYQPNYLNTANNGLVYWNINSPKTGEWLIHLSANNQYGVYNADVLPQKDFEELFIARDETAYPHSAED